DQTARAVKDQARTLIEMTTASQNTSRQIKAISRSNQEQSIVAGSLLTTLAEIRRITERNASGVRNARGGTDGLVRRADRLAALVAPPARRRASVRGHKSNGS